MISTPTQFIELEARLIRIINRIQDVEDTQKAILEIVQRIEKQTRPYRHPDTGPG